MTILDIENIKPKSVEGELFVHEVDNEVLLYHSETDNSACLETRAYSVWQLCDGTNTLAQIIECYGEIDPEVVDSARSELIVLKILNELRSIELIESAGMPQHFAPLNNNRREFLKGAAITGIPLVVGLPIPAAAQQASCLPKKAPCTADSQCCSGKCNGQVGKAKCGGN